MARSWTPSQKTAINLRGKTLLVSAAAGSGKTSVLTERIIRSLLDPDEPADLSRMLVVTFTRAAAAELKSRIAQALSEALAKDPGNARLSKQLFLLGSAQISTIDSFFQKIVRANFDNLDLPASFRIASESEIAPISTEILEEVMSDFYSRYEKAQDANDLFGRIRSNPFARVMDHLMSNRSDGKLNEILLEFLKLLSSYPQGIGLLKENERELRDQSHTDFLQTRYGRFIAAELREYLTDYLKVLQRVADFLETDPHAKEIHGGTISCDYDFSTAVLHALDQESYLAVQAVMQSFAPVDFSRRKYKPEPIPWYQVYRTKWRKRIKKLQEFFVFSPQELERQALETADLCAILYAFYSEYSTRLMQEKRALGVLEFNDVRAILYRLLTDANGAPSEVANALAEEYQAVYIDEYQDVDYVQDSIFAMIGGTRRFMVGDIKQSIYGFRGSEPSIFADYRRKMPLYGKPGADTSDGNCIFMSENFRCNDPIIRFTNAVCGFLFSACESSIQYRPEDDLVHQKLDPPTPIPQYPLPVTVSVFDKEDKKNGEEDDEEEETSRDEVVWVAAEISRLLREESLDTGAPILPSDISILVRTKAQGKYYKKELEALGIPVNATTSSDILSDPLLIDTLNLLRAIDNPYRDLPLTEYLLSSLGGFSLEELEMVRMRTSRSKSLYDAMLYCAQEEANDVLSQKTRQAVDWLDAQRESSNTLPADGFLRLLFQEEIFDAYTGEPALMFLYEQARTYQKTAWCGLYGFLQHFDKICKAGSPSAGGFSAEGNAVTIMTVHHSKGLEFPVVFLCSCGSLFNKKDAAKTLVYHKDLGAATKLYDRTSGNTDDTIYRMIVKEAVRLDQNEENIRTLYVALTRARERLYVTGTLGGKWVKALENARAVQRNNRSDILGCGSYLSWILAALEQPEAKTDDFPCTFRHFFANEVKEGLPYDAESQQKIQEQKAAEQSPDTERYVEILKKHGTYSYPLDSLRGLPTKAAASRLQRDLLDILQDEEAEEESLKAQIELMRSTPHSFDTLLQAECEPKATDVGTATHHFLEFCNFERFSRTGVEEECTHLIENGFILPSTEKLLNKKQLAAFRESELMQWILSAKRVIREQKFGLHVPMSELTQKDERKQELQEHTLFVQGSIDLILQNEQGVVLIDYKTDHISPEERADPVLLRRNMTKKHSVQLSYYAKAAQELFGKASDAVYVYSLSLGRVIPIDPAE